MGSRVADVNVLIGEAMASSSSQEELTFVPGTTIGSGLDTLTLLLADASAQSDVQVSIEVDGQQVGGVQTITALQPDSMAETLTVLGNWEGSPNSVVINDLNGTPTSSDTISQVLYVDGVSYNGTIVSDKTQTLISGSSLADTIGPLSTEATTPFPLGVYVGFAADWNSQIQATFVTELDNFEKTMGAAPSFLDVGLDDTAAISTWTNNFDWVAASVAATPGLNGIVPVISFPLTSTLDSADTDFRAFASGQYDSMIASMVKTWADYGYSTQYWRVGLEMNIEGMPTYAGAMGSQEQQDWISAYQHVYTVLHKAGQQLGINVQVVWNPGVTPWSGSGNAVANLYPGNQFVDVIGADVYADPLPYSLYDFSTGQIDSSLSQWEANPVNLEHYYTYPAGTEWSTDGSGGDATSLQDLINLAKVTGKPLAIPETGAGDSVLRNDLQDNPYFVQWLSQTLQQSGVPIQFVDIWDSNGAANYAFSDPGDDKPLEAAAWAADFGAEQTIQPISLTTLNDKLTTTDASSVLPFAGTTIADANAGQTETVNVVVSDTADGLLSDPNAAADGSVLQSDVWTDTGSVDSVTTALDGLVFTPTDHQVAPGQIVSTILTATITDTAGQLNSASTTINTSAVASPLTFSQQPSSVTTNGATGTDPFDGVVLSDPNSTQVETATVTVSNPSNGTLSDPNAASDGSEMADGTWEGSSTAASIAADLANLTFVPNLQQLVAGTPLTTELTATVTDTAGQTASAISVVSSSAASPTSPVVVGSGANTLALTVAEDAYLGNAQFTVNVDGAQVGGIQTATAQNDLGQSQVFDVRGNFSAGTHTVSVDFLNEAGNGTPSADRNLYVLGASYDGVIAPSSEMVLLSDGLQTTTVGDNSITLGNSGSLGFTFTFTGALTPVSVGSGPDMLALFMAERAEPAGAQFSVSVDGAQIGGVQTTQADSLTGQSQEFDVNGTFPAGSDTVTITYLNASSSLLFVDNATINGFAMPNSALVLSNSGSETFDFAGPSPNAPVTIGSGDGTLALNVSERGQPTGAQFTIDVDGTQIGGVQTTTADSTTGQMQTIDVLGNFSAGANTILVNYLNAANSLLNLDSANIDGTTVPGSALTLSNIGAAGFTFLPPGPAAPGTTVIGTGPDTLALTLSQRAQPAGALFTVSVDGTQIDGVQSVTAATLSGQTQVLDVVGNFASGPHTASIDYLNASNSLLSVSSATINGAPVPGGALVLSNSGTASLSFIMPSSQS